MSHERLVKYLFKRMKYVGQTLSNIVGPNMFDSFEQHNQTWMKFDFVQTFHPTLSNIFIRVIKNTP